MQRSSCGILSKQIYPDTASQNIYHDHFFPEMFPYGTCECVVVEMRRENFLQVDLLTSQNPIYHELCTLQKTIQSINIFTRPNF